MTNKTCGNCKHYIAEMYHCSKHDVMAEPHNTCEDCTAITITNGDKIRQMSNDELAGVIECPHFEGMCIHRADEYPCKCCKRDWLNAPAESQLNDAIQNVIKDGAKTAIDIHEAAYAPDMNDGTMANCVAENAKSGGEK